MKEIIKWHNGMLNDELHEQIYDGIWKQGIDSKIMYTGYFILREGCLFIENIARDLDNPNILTLR